MRFFNILIRKLHFPPQWGNFDPRNIVWTIMVQVPPINLWTLKCNLEFGDFDVILSYDTPSSDGEQMCLMILKSYNEWHIYGSDMLILAIFYFWTKSVTLTFEISTLFLPMQHRQIMVTHDFKLNLILTMNDIIMAQTRSFMAIFDIWTQSVTLTFEILTFSWAVTGRVMIVNIYCKLFEIPPINNRLTLQTSLTRTFILTDWSTYTKPPTVTNMSSSP